MDPNQPSQRSRLQQPKPESVLQIKRSDPWFDDGTIVIQARDTQFRAYRGILTLCSPIFYDMFSIPQPTTGDELVDGCPVVHVSDSAEDWQYVLRALCERRYVSLGGSLSLSVIAAFLRLGRKYEIAQLHTEALTRLNYEFPSTLEKCEEMVGSTMIEDDRPLASLVFEVIELAHEHNLRHLLPWAYTVCCHHITFEDIFGTFDLDNGRRIKLANEDQRVCIIGWRDLVSVQTKLPFFWLSNDGNPIWDELVAACGSKRRCITARQKLRDEIFCHGEAPKCCAMTFWDTEWGVDMCGVCGAEAKEMHHQALVKLWYRLPTIFGLPGWDKINEE